MKIQVVSDLHLEFSETTIPNNNADVLVLSGDILLAHDLHQWPPGHHDTSSRRYISATRFRNFLQQVSKDFPAVIYVAGNHEFYHGSWTKTHTILRNECSQFSNIFYLEKECKVINDVTFVGGTLWTDMNKGDPRTCNAIRGMMNDFSIIRNDLKGYIPLSPNTVAERHKETLDFIQLTIDQNPTGKFVVVGHHAPSALSIADQYKDRYLMNGGYCSDLTNFIEKNTQICLWTHGHTHTVFDYKIGSTRIVCNPRGYTPYEDTNWNPATIFEI